MLRKFFCKISSDSASNKVKGGESSMQTGSFDQIYQNYFDSVYRYALSLSGNTQAAEKIAQKLLYKAMRTMDQFQGRSIQKN